MNSKVKSIYLLSYELHSISEENISTSIPFIHRKQFPMEDLVETSPIKTDPCQLTA